MLQEQNYKSRIPQELLSSKEQQEMLQRARNLIQYVLIQESCDEPDDWIALYAEQIGKEFDTDKQLQKLCFAEDYESAKNYLRKKFPNLPKLSKGTDFSELRKKAA